MEDYDKIPLELRQLRQWVSFTRGPEKHSSGKLKKTPWVPGENTWAKPNNPQDWRDFKTAAKYGIPAFVLTAEDPYCFLDVDDASEAMQQQVFTLFNSYTEFSVGGNGFHVIFKGKLSGRGLKRCGLELYDRVRFVLFTGQVMEGKEEIKEIDPKIVEELEAEMNAGKVMEIDMQENPVKLGDEIVLARARKKYQDFQTLWEGAWESLNNMTLPKEQRRFPTQSEADNCLIGYLASISAANEQVRRLFRASALFRSKKTPRYVDYSLMYYRKQQQKEAKDLVFIDEWIKRSKLEMAVEKDDRTDDDLMFQTMPEGLLKRLYETFMDCPVTQFPLREGSLAAAFVVALTLFSRKYQTFTKGALNMIMVLLGIPGCGKDIIAQGPDALFAAAECDKLLAQVFGGELRSKPAVEDALKASPRHVSYIGEIASFIRGICDERAPAHLRDLRTTLTEVWSKGASQLRLRQTKKEQGEHRETIIHRPCLTVYGECPVAEFYMALGSRQGGTGFIPRLTVLEVDHHHIHERRCKQTPFRVDILAIIRNLAEEACKADIPNMLGNSADPVIVPCNTDAQRFLEEVEGKMRRRMIQANGDATLMHEVGGRSAEKMLRVATLLAVCSNPQHPRVTLQHMEWAELFLKCTDAKMVKRIFSGEHDEAVFNQKTLVKRWIEICRRLSPQLRAQNKHFPTPETHFEPCFLPYGYLSDKAQHSLPFKNDKRGKRQALWGVLRDMMEAGELLLLTANQVMVERYGFKGEAFMIITEPELDRGLYD